MGTTRVGVLGARGRMGTEIGKAVTAAPDLELVAQVTRGDPLTALTDAGADVVVDVTHPDVALDHVRFALDAGIAVVVGTSGFDAARLDTLAMGPFLAWSEGKGERVGA